MSGFNGDVQIFDNSKAPKNDYVTCMSSCTNGCLNPLAETKAFFTIRSGIFAKAVDILEGKSGSQRSLEPPRQWILNTCQRSTFSN